MYDWGDIRIFLAVAAEGSTLAASKKLGMNQTTVSRRIRALEQALGLTLFERDTRGYALTAQGSAMIDVAGQMGAAAESLAARAGHVARMNEGKIRVTAAHASMEHWVLPLIAEFRRRYPGIQFETNSARHYVSLEDGDADIAFRASDSMKGDTLIARKLPPVAWGVYCSKGYRDRFGMPSGPDQMSGHPVLTYPDTMIDNVALMTWLNDFIDPKRVVSTVDSVVTMSASLRSEDAVGVLPCVEGDPIGDLIMCFTHERLSSGLWLVASPDAYQEPRVRRFMSFVGDNFPKHGGPVHF